MNRDVQMNQDLQHTVPAWRAPLLIGIGLLILVEGGAFGL